MDKLNNFSQNLKLLRVKQNMKSFELAKKLGVSPAVVSSWENGRHLPTINYVITLSEIFKVSVDDLFGININKTKLEYNDNILNICEELKLLTDDQLEDVKFAIKLIKRRSKKNS